MLFFAASREPDNMYPHSLGLPLSSCDWATSLDTPVSRRLHCSQIPLFGLSKDLISSSYFFPFPLLGGGWGENQLFHSPLIEFTSS